MTPPPDFGGYEEPIGDFLWRKHFEAFAAVYLAGTLAALDAGVLWEGNRPVSGLDLPLVHLLLLASVVLLLAVAGTKRGLRRYVADGDLVRLPVAGAGLPPRIRVDDVAALALIPGPPPVRNRPSAVLLGVRARDGSVAKLAVDAPTFGYGNLRDLVRRLPEDRLEPRFARPWRDRIAGPSRGGVPGGRKP